MVTLAATEEPHLALIRSPQLAQPPECKVIFAFGTLDLDLAPQNCLLGQEPATAGAVQLLRAD